MTRPLIVQFGAGNIGRSLVGQLFSLAGWEVVFLDVYQPVIDALNKNKRYRVVVKDELLPGQAGEIEVKNVSGILLSDHEEAIQALVRADLIGTSVGAANLPSTCALVATALQKRKVPLSMLLCENLHDAAKLAKANLEKELPVGFPLAEKIGLVEAAISKMVPSTPAEVRERDPLEVWAEAYNTLYLDIDGCLGNPPTVPGVAWRSNFSAYVDRKLLLHNFGHAVAAYTGYLAGKEYIWQCMEDKGVRFETAACMMETAAGLAQRHANVFTFDENRAWADDLLRRFGNRVLADPVFRVGRDLKRKLALTDRCIGALKLLQETGLPLKHTAKAVAAGLLFAARDEKGLLFPGDEEVTGLAKKEGPEAVLTRFSGLDPKLDNDAIAIVAEQYRELCRA